jgi:hypothetical protein
MFPFAIYWLSAAKSGFASSSEWRAWADGEILAVDVPDVWLIELSLARTVDDLRRVVMMRADFEERLPDYVRPDDNAILGYLWLRYERGDFDLADCLAQAGFAADASSGDVECELFYALLADLKKCLAQGGDSTQHVHAAANVFAPLKARAELQWQRLLASDALTGPTQ